MRFNELYDVIDKKGNKIGVANWTECHTKGLLHQCIHAILFKDRSKKEVLMKKRSLRMVQEPDLWEIAVAGHLLSGKTPQQGILDEFQEELFLSSKLPSNFEIRKIGSFFNNDIPNNHELVYLFEIICPGPFFPDLEEIEGEPIFINFNNLLRNIKNDPQKYAQYSINSLERYVLIKKKLKGKD